MTPACQIQLRSALDVIRIASRTIDVPEEETRSRVAPKLEPLHEDTDRLMTIRTSKSYPKNAVVSVSFRGWWYYVDATDTRSKRAFKILRLLVGFRRKAPRKGPVRCSRFLRDSHFRGVVAARRLMCHSVHRSIGKEHVMNIARRVAASFILSALAITGCASHNDREDDEVTVAMGDVPPAVRATLERESAGGKVTEIEKEMKNGKTVYSADMTINGADWDIQVAEDGAVISKEREKAGEK